MDEFKTLDSGKRIKFETGAQRDIQEAKPRYDLIPVTALKRVAELYGRGAQKYDDWNWAKGIPMSRCLASAMRHLFQFAIGEKGEDHLSAVVFNIFCIIHYQEVGRKDLDDLFKYEPTNQEGTV